MFSLFDMALHFFLVHLKHITLPNVKVSATQYGEEGRKMFLSARSAFTLVSFAVSGYSAYWHVQLCCYSLYPLNMYGCSCWNG